MGRRTPRRFRDRGAAAAIVLLVAVAGVLLGRRAWQQYQGRQQFDASLAAIESQDWAAVGRAIEALEDRSDFEPHVLFLRASVLAGQRDHAGALYELSAVRAVGELREPASLLLGECLYFSGDPAGAEQVFLKLAAENPRLTRAHRWLAGIYHQRGNMRDARLALEQITKLEPADYRAHRQLALLYHRDLADNQKSVSYYRQALACDPPQGERDVIVRELAEALILRRDYAAARELLAEQSQPDAFSLAMMADCCWSLDRRDEARAHLEQAKDIDAGERLVLMLEGRMHMEEGRPAAAVAPLGQVLEADPHDFVCRYRLARAYQQMGDTARAKTELEKMQESKDLRFQLTQLYVDVVDHPEDLAVRDRIAELCQQLGQTELAEQWRRAAALSRQGSRPVIGTPPDEVLNHASSASDVIGFEGPPLHPEVSPPRLPKPESTEQRWFTPVDGR